MKFTINLEVAEEGFFSGIKKFGQSLKGKKKDTSKDGDAKYATFSTIDEALNDYAEAGKALFEFAVSSCNYGKDCVWYLSTPERNMQFDDNRKRQIIRVYQTANTALPKIRELTAIQLYDKVSDLDEDDQVITEDQAETISRDQFKQSIDLWCITIRLTKSGQIEVDYEFSSKVAKDDDVMIHIEDAPNGIVSSSSKVSVFY